MWDSFIMSDLGKMWMYCIPSELPEPLFSSWTVRHLTCESVFSVCLSYGFTIIPRNGWPPRLNQCWNQEKHGTTWNLINCTCPTNGREDNFMQIYESIHYSWIWSLGNNKSTDLGLSESLVIRRHLLEPISLPFLNTLDYPYINVIPANIDFC